MARDVLRCPPREIADVAEAATVPRQNPQWTDYAAADASAARHAARKGKAARQRAEERAAKARP
jgi:hypothetical protein